MPPARLFRRRCAAPLLVATLALGPAAAALAADDPCADLPPPTVKLNRLEDPVALDTHYPYKVLGTLAATPPRPGTRILGLTRGNASVRMTMKLSLTVDGRRRWACATPQLTVDFGFRPLTVYVAREFAPGSCAYQQIHEHEQRHVRAYQEHARAIEAEIAAALRERFAAPCPWYGAADELPARLQREIDERWLPYVKRRLGEVESAQREIDSAEEYARVAASCDGAIRRVVER